MVDLIPMLNGLGVGLATNAIYDLLKSAGGKLLSKSELEAAMKNQLELHGVTLSAETLITALSSNGALKIEGSNLYAVNSIVFGSVEGTASVGNNSSMRTDSSQIEIGAGAQIRTSGNAHIKQHPDGSISFHVGETSAKD